MKIFTETEKWRDPWFRGLSAPAKILWWYLCENCNKIGVVDLDLKLATFDCGLKITPEHILELGDRVEHVSDKKFFIPQFIFFQNGNLSPNSPPHKKVIQLVEQFGLIKDGPVFRYPNARVLTELSDIQQIYYPKATLGLPTRKEEERNGKGKGTREECVQYCQEQGLTASDGEWFYDKCVGNGWKNSGVQIVDWKATVRAWAKIPCFPSQKAATGTGKISNMEMVVMKKNLDELEAKLHTLEGQYDAHQSWTASDIAERKRLKGIISELKTKLGILQ